MSPLRERQEARLVENATPEGRAAREAMVAAASARLNVKAMQDAGDSALRSHSRVAKVQWMRKVADEFSRGIAPGAPCAKGCNHCCHIAVIVSEDEAQVIGREIGVTPAEPPMERMQDQAHMQARLQRGATPDELMAEMQAQRDALVQHFTGTPCRFLVNGACSIYGTRPVPCRTHFVADRDDLLCRLDAGKATVSTPYFNANGIHQLYVDVLSPRAGRSADLRDFFPKGRG